MKIPERVRINHRYRGPRESVKASRTMTEVSTNLARIEEMLNGISARVASHRNNVYNGKKPSPVEEVISVQANHLSRRIQNVERGVYNG